MQTINELQLAKELIRYPSITPIDAGVMKFLEKKLRIHFVLEKNIFKEILQMKYIYKKQIL